MVYLQNSKSNAMQASAIKDSKLTAIDVQYHTQLVELKDTHTFSFMSNDTSSIPGIDTRNFCSFFSYFIPKM